MLDRFFEKLMRKYRTKNQAAGALGLRKIARISNTRPAMIRYWADSDPGGAINFILIKYVRVMAFSASHQEHADCHDHQAGEHPDVIFPGKEGGRF